MNVQYVVTKIDINKILNKILKKWKNLKLN